MPYSQLLSTYLGEGTQASRATTPNAAPGVSCVYYETDTGRWMGWTGSLWVPISGGINTVSTKTASYSVVAADRGTCFIANAASLVFTLPAPSAAGAGFSVVVKNNNQTTTAVKTNASGVLIDGVDCSTTGATTGLTTAYGAVRYLTDGTNWFTVSMDGSSGGGSSTLAGDTDVAISSPSSGQALVYNGTKWANATAPGAEIGYVSGTAAVTTASTSMVDVTGMSLTVTVASNPILIDYFCPLADTTAGGGTTTPSRFDIQIYDVTGAAVIEQAYILTMTNSSGTSMGGMVHLAARVNPSAGSRTYKVQFASESSGVTCRLYAAATAPMWLRITG